MSSNGGRKNESVSLGSNGGPRGANGGLIPGLMPLGPIPRGWNIRGPAKDAVK